MVRWVDGSLTKQKFYRRGSAARAIARRLELDGYDVALFRAPIRWSEDPRR